jgi:hypothetical protein
MTYYKCRKCDYKTKCFRDIKNHINIQKTCIKDLSCLELTNDEIFIMTIIPFVNSSQNFDANKIKNYKYIYKNKKVLFEELHNIDKNKLKICKYCNISYNKIQELKEHIILECFEKQMDKDNIKNNSININTLNVCNNITNNITNINNIILKIDNPISFDEDWDISQITEPEKCQLILSKLMYTQLLNQILKNDNNLNVVIDKNKEFGVVYKNEFEKYIKMEIKEIISNSMEKIHKNLLEINDELKKSGKYEESFIEYKKKDINNKHQCYINNQETKEKVDLCMANIFNDKKDVSYKLMKKYLLNTSNDDLSY